MKNNSGQLVNWVGDELKNYQNAGSIMVKVVNPRSPEEMRIKHQLLNTGDDIKESLIIDTENLSR